MPNWSKTIFRNCIIIASFVYFGQTIFADTLFDKPNQTNPLNTMQSMIDLGKDCASEYSRESCRHLTKLCHDGGDSDVWDICLIGGADEKTKEYFNIFVRSISIGAAVENGNAAIVHFMFKDEGEWKQEYMDMIRSEGKWLLVGF